MRFSKLVAGVVVATLLSGCEIFDDEDPKAPADLVDFEPTLSVSKDWSQSIGSQHEYLSPMRLAEDAGVIFAANLDGEVTAFRRNSGEKVWEVALDIPLSGGVSASRGLVTVGGPQGEVVALSTVDGTEKWRAKLATEVLSAPVNTGRQVVVHTPDGLVTGLSSSDGSELWKYKETLPLLTMQGVSEPILEGPLALVGFASGKLSAIRTDTGLPAWEALIALPSGRSDIERMVDLDGEPVVVGQSVIAATLQGSIKALDMRGGRVLWEADASTSKALAAGFSQVYIAELDGSVTAYRADTGAQVWRNDQLSYRGLSAPVTWSSYLAVGDADGYVHVMSQRDGSFVARFSVSGAVRSLMASRGKSLYVLDDSGRITALSIEE